MERVGNHIPTIDVVRVTIEQQNDDGTYGEELGLDTASQIAVATDTQTADAIRLIIKGALRAQKPAETTVTGHTLTLTDNVFTPQIVQLLQGGTIAYDANGKFKSYTPLPAGASAEEKRINPFRLNAYSAIYTSGAEIEGYEKISYPNCKGAPVAFNSQDGVFRVMTYTISSYPNQDEPPYTIEVLTELPVLENYYSLKKPEEETGTT